jgi:hypothetical protein
MGFRISFLVALAIAMGSIAILVQYQSFAQTSEPKGTAVNSKYLTIKDLRFRNEGFSNSITGTIVNSTSEISFTQVYALLYDKDNKLISVESGSVDVSDLKAGDNLLFKISLVGLSSSDTVDHYTVIPGGSPS